MPCPGPVGAAHGELVEVDRQGGDQYHSRPRVVQKRLRSHAGPWLSMLPSPAQPGQPSPAQHQSGPALVRPRMRGSVRAAPDGAGCPAAHHSTNAAAAR